MSAATHQDAARGPAARRPVGSPHRINFSWLVRLRWGAIAGQIVTILVAHRVLDVPLPLGPLLAVVAGVAVMNAAATLWLRRRRDVSERALVVVLALDVLGLTALLSLSGGPSNPFSFLYLVHIALAAVVLRSGWTWALVLVSLAASAGLFLWDAGLGLGRQAVGGHAHHMRLHLEGMWVACAVAAAFIVYFVTRIQRALAEREADLHAERALAARNEKLAALATLAAGAAHELATPLGTIAVVARELERRTAGDRAPSGGALRDDLALIRSEVDRCRRILDRMAADAGERAGEGFTETSVAALLAAAATDVAPAPPVRIEIDAPARAVTLSLPVEGLAQALRGLVRNAQEAAPGAGEVRLRATLDADALAVRIEDDAGGMTPEVLARAGEPFFTTKPPGKGMGLGLFLARTMAERLGGGLTVASSPSAGTCVTMRLPVGGEAAVRRVDRGARAAS